MSRSRYGSLSAFAVIILLVGCGREIRLEPDPVVEVDFSGQWEINYQLSERVQENMMLLAQMARSEAIRSGRYSDGALPGAGVIRLAESVSRAVTLDIEQTEDEIRIKREADFTLNCRFDRVEINRETDALGVERCGWDAHQLVFALQLPDGLAVTHRLTLGPDGDRLNVATTVRTRGRGQSFTINRAYTRYEELDDEFDCKPMVTGEQSCLLRGSKQR